MTYQHIKPIGGEAEYAQPNFEAITQTGRSSLRLIIESAKLQAKHVALPDYLCEVIIDIFKEYQSKIHFYPVNQDLSLDYSALPKHFDVLYIINYFGMDLGKKLTLPLSAGHTLIIDDVFYPMPRMIEIDTACYAFNSLRKISKLADGSLIRANRPLLLELITGATNSPFSTLKYSAKALKHRFIYQHIEPQIPLSEQRYLTKFEQAERLLDSQKNIVAVSMQSQIMAMEFYRQLQDETQTRRENYLCLKQLLANNLLQIDTDFYSFSVLKHARKSELKKYLASQSIYLPTHWPVSESNYLKSINNISINWLSIPLDARYTIQDMERLAKAIQDFDQHSTSF
ncbi:hypothetical protein [Shewanella sp. CG12_big_fil_rev_8_21_14_0_65_47_15]|uniref:hypothetical protein n=1 Tax=Shewanella sp. CG12_big_fil_rev_8_21_14_0_65_47_15 TaxID=1975537 RepID=UPI000CBBED4C|nr:hypothetical protein [Shewanella sp. CG12_big_fil_rev_8_21_14_0_65_47_15]PIW60930.1 MAG: hypothetical protein COW15_10665 [Shewanella sp. CG12_big_fil_rev_8_21_14_0_65_47_15]